MDSRDAMHLSDSIRPRRWPDYRTLRRWHFYAGLACIPVVLWLCLTGSLYLFKPQIDAWLERGYDRLPADRPAMPVSRQVAAALQAVPGGRLNAYELPAAPRHAARVLVGAGSDLIRVYVDPYTTHVLGQVRDDLRPTRLLFHLHGELMLGATGSMIVETTASWAVVMLVTGLVLWWPRSRRGMGGVLYPRLRRGDRVFWRDLHAVTGVWVSALALFLIVSGLPWSRSWGGLLKQARELAAHQVVQQDWTTGRADELAERRLRNAPPSAGEHHHGDSARPATDVDLHALDAVATTVAARRLAPPVLVSPPSGASHDWQARSDSQNRPRRTTLTLDAQGRVLREMPFSRQPFLDRAIGVGVAAHEGQLFGWPNQLLGLFTASGLGLVCVSALLLWTRRRPAGALGAPAPVRDRSLAIGAFVLIGVLGLLLPLLGSTLLLVLALERLVLARNARIAAFLGLPAPVRGRETSPDARSRSPARRTGAR